MQFTISWQRGKLLMALAIDARIILALLLLFSQ
ncbi:Uncharacterised protein [Neisseria lactamica]|uniref:Uncharacterized protein n=1 Tax=Neisseria lactamica TaxID=486 RepID=A0A378VP82_NEILA|nr:Uncharacterised protein [Neisseria lactamica]